MSVRYVQMRGLADGAMIRSARFDDREHVVVPVVAMVGDAVVRPMGSEGPELVPVEALMQAPGGWNGRPVVPDHPGDGLGSANTPSTLDAMRFGYLFNARVEDGKLKVDAYLDPARAERVGEDAVSVIERCRRGEKVEVSVGAWVKVEPRRGSKNGKPYEYVWLGCVPDHLAMLPVGTVGACSVDMGCGAPRAAEEVKVHKMATQEVTVKIPGLDVMRKLCAKLGLTALAEEDGSGTSDVELRQALWSELRADVPAFDGIAAVYPDTNTVIYWTMPKDELLTWRRSFTVGEDGAVTLGDDAEEVVAEVVYKPVAAAGKEGSAVVRAACGCKGKGEGNAVPPDEAKGGHQVTKLEELAGRLIACDRSPFSEQDKALLTSMDEDKLASLVSAYNAGEAAPKPTPPAQPDQSTLAPVPAPQPATPSQPVKANKTEEEWLAEAPASVREVVARAKAEDDARREVLVTSLAKHQDAYTADQLKAKPTDELQALARMLKLDRPTPLASYAGRVMPDPNPAEPLAAPPDPWDIAGLQAARQASPKKEAV